MVQRGCLQFPHALLVHVRFDLLRIRFKIDVRLEFLFLIHLYLAKYLDVYLFWVHSLNGRYIVLLDQKEQHHQNERVRGHALRILHTILLGPQLHQNAQLPDLVIDLAVRQEQIRIDKAEDIIERQLDFSLFLIF